MKDYLKFMLAMIVIIVSVSVLASVGEALGFFKFAFFAPKIEQVRYNTFKESQAYNDGMVRDLEDIKREYLKATPDQQAALRGIALHRFSVYPIDRLPPDLQSFYFSINQ